MNRDTWSNLLESRFKKTVEVLNNKNKEYATDTDVLHNFKRAAQIANTTPEKALWGFMLKHFTSMSDIVDNLEKGIIPTSDTIDEKLGDLINYQILLEGLLKERIANKVNETAP